MIKNWIRGAVALGLAAAVLGVTQTARAGESEGERKAAKEGEQFYGGVINAIDFKAGTVTIKKGDTGTMTFTCPQTAKYYVKTKKTGATLQDFKVGDKVSVYYTVDSGTPTAHELAESGSHAHKKEKKGE